MDNINDSNAEPHNPTTTHEGRGESSNNTSPTVMTTQENVPNVNANNVVSMDNMSAAYLLLSVQQGNNFKPHQDPNPGCNSTENTAKEDRMDIDEPMDSSSPDDEDDDDWIAPNTHTKSQRNPNHNSNFVCDLCDAPLTNKSALKRHKNSVHGGEQKELCDICSVRFRSRRSLTIHRKNKHPDRWAKCARCDTEFRSSEAYNYHMRHVHEGKVNLSCDVCHAKFQSRNRLLLHRQQQHGDQLTTKDDVTKKDDTPKVEHKCSDCGFSSNYKSSLARHYANIHSDGAVTGSSKPEPKPEPETDDSYDCSRGCGYRSRRYAAMISHEKSCRKARRRG